MAISLFSFHLHGETENKEKVGFLWKISGNGLPQPSYLLGTHHAFPEEFVYRIPQFSETFYSMEQLIVEIDIDPSDTASLRQMALSFSTKERYLPPQVKYSELLDKDDFRLLDSLSLKHLGHGADENRASPMILGDNIVKRLFKELGELLAQEGVSDSVQSDSLMIFFNSVQSRRLPMDLALTESARARKLSIVGLDVSKGQVIMKPLPNVPLEQELRTLMLQLKNYEKQLEIAGLILSAYFEQDLQTAMELRNTENQLSGWTDGDDPKVNTKQRNLDWIPIIEFAIQEKKSMIAVGAGHLLGEYGLINLLRQKGYTVEEFK